MQSKYVMVSNPLYDVPHISDIFWGRAFTVMSKYRRSLLLIKVEDRFRRRASIERMVNRELCNI